MNRKLTILGMVAVAGATGLAVANLPSGAWADSTAVQIATSERTTTFAVENMTCALCPITVRKAMEQVKGVKSVKIDFDAQTAMVVFDPSVATSAQIANATKNAGYPASPKP